MNNTTPAKPICAIPIPDETLTLPSNVLQLFKSTSLLSPFQLELLLLKPDRRLLYYFDNDTGTYTVWYKHEINQESSDWYNSNIPVQNQGVHESCVSMSVAENISDARHNNGIDVVFTPYSHQFLTDFLDDKGALEKYIFSKGEHYCSGNFAFEGLVYAMRHGIPTNDAWTGTGCRRSFRFNRDVSLVKSKHVLNDVKLFADLHLALRYLKIQPILGSIAIFSPEFKNDDIYRGPRHKRSKFKGWHSLSIRSIKIINGETVAVVKNSYGAGFGDRGHRNVSLDVMLVELKTTRKPSFQSPSLLFRSFSYGEARSKYEKNVDHCYAMCTLTPERQKHATFLILEGIFNNTSGHVYRLENGDNEIIGSPTARALFKWAIEMQGKANFTYTKNDSTTIKGSPSNSNRRCLGTAVDCQKVDNSGVRIHWKGSGNFILDKCTKVVSEDGYCEISERQRNYLRDIIDKMVAKQLICIAIAFKDFEREDLPPKKNRKQWQLPCENLTLLAIFAITNPCILPEDEVGAVKQAPLDFEEEVEENASKTHLDDTERSSSIRDPMPPHDGINWFDFDEKSALPWEEGYDLGVIIKPNRLGTFYDIGLYGRLGLYCHNVQQGTDYKFKSVSKLYTQCGLFAKLFITVEATKHPADCSPFTFETCVKTDDDLAESDQLQWETCFCSVEGSEEEENQWDNEALPDHYKGELPKWFSDANQQQFYVVEKLELRDEDNEWLHLFTEFAFYTKWNLCLTPLEISECLPLDISEVVVETRGEAETEAREKLKAANAIFYISFECENYPQRHEKLLKKRRYRAVVRKTMDGKPGHMRLEVRCWEHPI